MRSVIRGFDDPIRLVRAHVTKNIKASGLLPARRERYRGVKSNRVIDPLKKTYNKYSRVHKTYIVE